MALERHRCVQRESVRLRASCSFVVAEIVSIEIVQVTWQAQRLKELLLEFVLASVEHLLLLHLLLLLLDAFRLITILLLLLPDLLLWVSWRHL